MKATPVLQSPFSTHATLLLFFLLRHNCHQQSRFPLPPKATNQRTSKKKKEALKFPWAGRRLVREIGTTTPVFMCQSGPYRTDHGDSTRPLSFFFSLAYLSPFLACLFVCKQSACTLDLSPFFTPPSPDFSTVGSFEFGVSLYVHEFWAG